MQASAPARARVLEVLEEELEERYGALGHPAHRASQDNVHLRRLYKASLPSAEMNHCKDLLRKLAAIDHARELAEAVRVLGSALPCRQLLPILVVLQAATLCTCCC